MMEDSAISNGSVSAEAEAQRRDPRDSLLLLAALRLAGDSVEGRTVRVRNVSSGGLMAEVGEGYRPGDRIEVKLDGVGLVLGSVAWAEAGRIGVAFDHPIDRLSARKPTHAGPGRSELFRPVMSGAGRPALKPR